MDDGRHAFFCICQQLDVDCLSRGYESWADTLFALQEQEDQGPLPETDEGFFFGRTATPVITHCRLFESSSATVKDDVTVEVLDGKIAAVYPSVKNKNALADEIIDAHGKFLMPGLWDMHAHYSKNEGTWYLAGGVTHVRDMGNANILTTYRSNCRK